jgi:YqaJ-like recombinase protein
MKIFNVEQGSGAWLQLRLGIPTASNFAKILTPKKLEFSAQARGYAFRLVAEKLLNESLDSLDYIDHVQRGKDLEPQAIRMYEFAEETETKPVGFITTDDGRVGATPDRLIVGKPAALEVKCPAPHTHIEYLVDGFGADYVIQAQGQAYVGEFEYVDRYSFHPALPPMLAKTYRDDAIIGKLRAALDQFFDVRDEIEAKVRASGFTEEHAHMLTAVDEMRDRHGAARRGPERADPALLRAGERMFSPNPSGNGRQPLAEVGRAKPQGNA